jgi:site-specific DNA recombinase
VERHHDPRSCGLQQKLDDLEARRAALEGELEAAPPPAPRLHPNLAELYRQKVAALHAALADPVLGPEAMERIRSLIERVVLVPEAGALRIDLEGQVGAILGLCADAQKPGRDVRALAEQLVMVAGAGFEPATFRL